MKLYLTTNKLKLTYLGIGLLFLLACKKTPKEVIAEPTVPTNPGNTGDIIPPKSVPVANTIGFFMDDWQGKAFVAPNFVDVPKSTSPANVTVGADFSETVAKVSKYLFGNNTNPYIGQLATEPLLVGHVKNLSPNILRFPGGNIASVFFWNADANQKPADAPSTLYNTSGTSVNAGYWYGKNTANWTLSLANYYNFLQQTNSTGIITVNYSYARYGTSTHPDQVAAHLAADWVRFDKGKTKYWEIGNEDAGPWQAGYKINTATNKDGQPEIINGALYGKHFKVFADSMRKAASEIGSVIKIGGQLIQYDATTSSNVVDKNWNSGFLSAAAGAADFYIVHTYYTPYAQNSTASVILNTAVTESKMIMDYMKKTTQDNGASLKPIAMTEWNIFAEGSKQQVSHIAGMHAIMVLGELIKNNYGMASRWDLANGYSSGNDHGMFSLADEGDGTTKWTPRPAFYHIYYFQKYFGDRMVTSTVTGSTDVVSYASGYASGEAGIVLVNKGTSTQIVNTEIKNFNAGSRYYYYTLTGSNDNGEFSRKLLINDNGPDGVSGGPTNYQTLVARSATVVGGIKLTLPPRSVVYLVVDKK
ncbi:alpha-L-arabinofuranosidase [Pedobacter frigiditerrae]|uniref:Alpha-L-arabinofuranosidase n=1 Tax=Pedobacter frigiditerrae TaxID=2530452 RepID=A0A4V2MIT8_9SPHI|nr:alpha-L-arabinofuranosidase [Pedobacter frigiditerrae]TCC91786.1 alpha-L-arabinofuranosidase [Pedobacter frigiditerrae]